MKKIIIMLTMFLFSGSAFAAAPTSDECMKFFNQYVSAANGSSKTITSMYMPNAKIIKQVQSTGKQQTLTPKEYFKYLGLYSAVGKMRSYSNEYRNPTVSTEGDYCKVSSTRYPSLSHGKDAFKAYILVGKNDAGALKIYEDFTQIKSDKL